MSAAGVAGGAVAGTVVMDGVAEHIRPASAPADPTQPAASEQQASSANQTTSGENAGQAALKRGTFKGDLTRLQQEALSKNEGNSVGAQGELDAIERLLQEGKNVEKLPDRGVPNQTEPDLRVDGKLREIKTRKEPLNNRWIKDELSDSNGQLRDSNYENPHGSVDLQLKDQVETDGQLLEKAERQVRGAITHERGSNITDVRLYNDGRLIGKWSRVGDKVIRTFSTTTK